LLGSKDTALQDGQDAGTAVIYAEARLGELLKATPREYPLGSPGQTKTLPNGITKATSHQAQTIAANPEKVRVLMEIRDRGYYRDVLGYETFEAYCKDRWDFSRQHAYRFIDSAKVVLNVTDRLQNTPANLEQTRPLAKLEPDQQREAWVKAVETAPEGKVTAASAKSA